MRRARNGAPFWMRCADDILGNAISLSTVRILWKERLMRRADMFLDNEAARRAEANPRADWLEAKGQVRYRH